MSKLERKIDRLERLMGLSGVRYKLILTTSIPPQARETGKAYVYRDPLLGIDYYCLSGYVLNPDGDFMGTVNPNDSEAISAGADRGLEYLGLKTVKGFPSS